MIKYKPNHKWIWFEHAFDYLHDNKEDTEYVLSCIEREGSISAEKEMTMCIQRPWPDMPYAHPDVYGRRAERVSWGFECAWDDLVRELDKKATTA